MEHELLVFGFLAKGESDMFEFINSLTINYIKSEIEYYL